MLLPRDCLDSLLADPNSRCACHVVCLHLISVHCTTHIRENPLYIAVEVCDCLASSSNPSHSGPTKGCTTEEVRGCRANANFRHNSLYPNPTSSGARINMQRSCRRPIGCAVTTCCPRLHISITPAIGVHPASCIPFLSHHSVAVRVRALVYKRNPLHCTPNDLPSLSFSPGSLSRYT